MLSPMGFLGVAVWNHTSTKEAIMAQREMMNIFAQNASCLGGSVVGRMTVGGTLSAREEGRGCRVWVASSVSIGRNWLYLLPLVVDRKG